MTSQNRIYSSSKVKQPFTKMHICSNLSKLLPQNSCTFYLRLAWNQFHSTLHPMEDRQKTCPMCVKPTSSAFVMSQWNSFGLGAWCHRIASLVWLNSACNCWTVSCISLQSAGSLPLCQYRWTARKCQRYSPKWLSTLWMIWQIIIDFLKLLSDLDLKINK